MFCEPKEKGGRGNWHVDLMRLSNAKVAFGHVREDRYNEPRNHTNAVMRRLLRNHLKNSNTISRYFLTLDCLRKCCAKKK